MIFKNKKWMAVVLSGMIMAGSVLLFTGCDSGNKETTDSTEQAQLTGASIEKPTPLPSYAPSSITMNGKEINPGEYDYMFYSFATYIPVAEDGTPQVNEMIPLEIGGMGETWEEMFLTRIADTYILRDEAVKNGVALTEEMLEELSYVEEDVKAVAEESGITVDELLAAYYGEKVTFDVYWKIQEDSMYANAYYQHMMTTFEEDSYMKEELLIFFEENKEYLAPTLYVPTVRHILIESVEAATEEEDAAAQEKAQEVLERLQNGEDMETVGTELTESGVALEAAEYSLTLDINFVPEFEEWAYDEARQPDDLGIVKTSYGYHVMKYISLSEEEDFTILEEIYRSEAFGRYLEDMKKLPEYEIVIVR